MNDDVPMTAPSQAPSRHGQPGAAATGSGASVPPVAAPQGGKPSAPQWRALLAAMSLALLAGLGWGWFGRDMAAGDEAATALAERAVLAHEMFAANEPPPLDASAATVAAGWLPEVARIRVPVPLLEELGFELAGGRLMLGESEPAALLLYRDEADRHLTLLMLNDVDDRAPKPMRRLTAGHRQAVSWVHGIAGVALASDTGMEALEAAARMVRAQLS